LGGGASWSGPDDLFGFGGVGEEVGRVDDGEWLVERRAVLDRAEAGWLERLARFDRDGGWAADGQLSCVSWLVWRTNMGRSTAFDKLRVAHELERRPVVAQAFREGRLSYCAVRAITRLDRPDPGVDAALVALAESGQASIVDLERVVRSYHLYADQDRPPPDDSDRCRDVKIIRGDGGRGQVVVTLDAVEVEEFGAALQAFVDLGYRSQPGDESSPEDAGGGEAPLEQASRAARKADAFMDLVRTALHQPEGGPGAGNDRYLVHLVTRTDKLGMTSLDGRPLHPAQAARVACDASTVAHTVGAGGEPLSLGRKTRDWSTAQRRAIAVRDGGRCRFVGCQYSHWDIHHIRAWQHDGPTDIDNGCCQCPRHHRMLHRGYRLEGDPNRQLRFYRPDGTYLGSTTPPPPHNSPASEVRQHSHSPSTPRAG
jgi:hypothetical protein